MPSSTEAALTAPYMRAVGVSGMLAPLMLETYLNPDLTGPERPYVLAHEWAHLSGFAPEEDASFVGRLAALRADVPSQYSVWLFLVSGRGDAVAGAGDAGGARWPIWPRGPRARSGGDRRAPALPRAVARPRELGRLRSRHQVARRAMQEWPDTGA